VTRADVTYVIHFVVADYCDQRKLLYHPNSYLYQLLVKGSLTF